LSVTANTPEIVTLNLFQGPLCVNIPPVREVKQPCVYILVSQPYGTLCIGVTSNLIQRLYQHRNRLTPGYTSKYAVYRLVRFEMFDDMTSAITREKQLKNWRRQWKINLIESENPQWVDLAVNLGLEPISD
tara:strand:+ start:4220 stop:4612 length:393 start_codon:yes stop_codon:yes gene_type:complete